MFQQIVICDFEYEVADGDLPLPLCMVAYVLDAHLRLQRIVRLWRGEFGPTPPFDIGPDTLFVGYSVWAEMTCFHVLGWQFPVHIFDQHTAYLSTSNILLPYDPDTPRKKPRKGLSAACKSYGLAGWENIDKPSIAKDIGEGRWQLHGQPAVLGYCEEDNRMSLALLRAQTRDPKVDTECIMHWSNYSAKAIALIQARGIPIDVRLWNLVQENKAAVIGEMLRRWDPSYQHESPIYSPDGEWSYARFERYLVTAGVPFWPRLDSGQLDTDSDAFRLMENYPGIKRLHALRDTIGFIRKARLPIGRDGRNRPSLFPLGTATGRNAHSKSPYNAHAAIRSFIKFPPDRIGAYLDWRTQEIGVAASQSGDEKLIEAYRGGDVYHALARVTGFTTMLDPVQWKREYPEVRERMKRLQLAINYGMGVRSLARGLDRHPLVASGILDRYRRIYWQFTEWRSAMVQAAMLERKIQSIDGWILRISSSPNQRALFNFPMQSGGAAMLREASVKLCQAGLVPSMLVHDAALFELENDGQVEHAKEIMAAAGRKICDGLEIGVDAGQLLRNGARYQDKRPAALEMWATITDALRNVGAIPEEKLDYQ
jgi:hypothetical protein